MRGERERGERLTRPSHDGANMHVLPAWLAWVADWFAVAVVLLMMMLMMPLFCPRARSLPGEPMVGKESRKATKRLETIKQGSSHCLASTSRFSTSLQAKYFCFGVPHCECYYWMRCRLSLSLSLSLSLLFVHCYCFLPGGRRHGITATRWDTTTTTSHCLCSANGIAWTCNNSNRSRRLVVGCIHYFVSSSLLAFYHSRVWHLSTMWSCNTGSMTLLSSYAQSDPVGRFVIALNQKYQTTTPPTIWINTTTIASDHLWNLPSRLLNPLFCVHIQSTAATIDKNNDHHNITKTITMLQYEYHLITLLESWNSIWIWSNLGRNMRTESIWYTHNSQLFKIHILFHQCLLSVNLIKNRPIQ